MNIFTITYPFSFILLCGFILGIGISVILFGSFTFLIVLILIYIGSFRIMPIIDIINNIVLKLFPQRVNKITQNIHKSFPVIYSDNFTHNTQYIYCFHPHGLFCISHYLHIATNLTDWKDKNINGTALHILWKLPFAKELSESYNFIKSDYTDMKNVLEKNKSLSVTLGGVKEMPLSCDNKITLNIAKKRGIFKMALETGVPIVPVIVYGENEIYKIYNNKILTYINNYLLKYNIYIPFPTLKSCLKWLSLFSKPLDEQIKTYIGNPILVQKIDNPSESDIINLRELYFKELRKLYDNTRPESYDKELYII